MKISYTLLIWLHITLSSFDWSHNLHRTSSQSRISSWRFHIPVICGLVDASSSVKDSAWPSPSVKLSEIELRCKSLEELKAAASYSVPKCSSPTLSPEGKNTVPQIYSILLSHTLIKRAIPLLLILGHFYVPILSFQFRPCTILNPMLRN